jgi:hypothetical protein
MAFKTFNFDSADGALTESFSIICSHSTQTVEFHEMLDTQATQIAL